MRTTGTEDAGVTTGQALAIPSVLDRIVAGVAAITPEGLKPQSRERQEDDVVVGHLDDYLQRLASYHRSENEAGNALVAEHNQLINDLAQVVRGDGQRQGGAASLFRSLIGRGRPDTDQKISRLEELETVIEGAKRHADFVNMLFWHELKTRIPAAASHYGVAVCSDWSVVAIQKPSASMHGLPSGLEEMVRDMFGPGVEVVFGGGVEIDLGGIVPSGMFEGGGPAANLAREFFGRAGPFGGHRHPGMGRRRPGDH